MPELQFNTDLIGYIADNRSEALSVFFGFFNFFGEVEGIILVVAGVYAMYDKELAIRISIIALATMTLNHLIKIVIANPRPFASEGIYLDKWEVSPFKARELAAEFSTPSGHAMVGAAFYGYLAAALRNRYATIGAIATILFVGLARPYLGVHYIEDIILGWILGAAIVFLAVRYTRPMGQLWSLLSHRQQILASVGLAILVWMLSLVASGGTIKDLSVPYLGYLGFLTGIVIAYPIEQVSIRFDPRSAPFAVKIVRFLIAVGFVIAPVVVVDQVIEAVIAFNAPMGHMLYYSGYALAGILGILGAPFVFVRLGLAKTLPISA